MLIEALHLSDTGATADFVGVAEWVGAVDFVGVAEWVGAVDFVGVAKWVGVAEWVGAADFVCVAEAVRDADVAAGVAMLDEGPEAVDPPDVVPLEEPQAVSDNNRTEPTTTIGLGIVTNPPTCLNIG